MGPKQSSPEVDGRTRAYSSNDVHSGTSNGVGRTAGLRYINGPDGPQIRYTGGSRPNSYNLAGLSIPTSGRNGPRDGFRIDDTDEESELSGGGHRLLIGSLPAHLSPHLLGGKSLCIGRNTNYGIISGWYTEGISNEVIL